MAGHKKITGVEREELAKKLRADYEAGASIRELADRQDRSYGFVYQLLVESGAELRNRGGRCSAE